MSIVEKALKWVEAMGTEEVRCRNCGGSGVGGYATREMAMDGGDASLEGQPIPCGCHGGMEGTAPSCEEADFLIRALQEQLGKKPWGFCEPYALERIAKDRSIMMVGTPLIEIHHEENAEMGYTVPVYLSPFPKEGEDGS